MERLHTGEQVSGIHGQTWNKFADTTKKVAQLSVPENRDSTRGASALRVLVQNQTGSDINADFPVLQIDGPLFLPSQRASVVHEGVQLVGKTPTASTPIDNVVIVQGPIPDTQLRPAVVRGPSWVDVEWTDSNHKCAKPTADNTKLVSASQGIKVIKHDPIVSYPATVKTLVWLDGGMAETYRLIRGRVYGTVTADQTEFEIDNVFPLAGGLNPLTNPASSTERVTVVNSQKESFNDDEYVTAIWFDTEFGSGWQTLVTERMRFIKGTWYAGTTTLMVNNIETLGAGVDPRLDATDADEFVAVENIPGNTYHFGDTVYAIGNVQAGYWEALPKFEGTETYRMVRGVTYGLVAATATTFQITSITALAGGLTPPTDPLTITNTQKEAFGSGAPVIAVWDGTVWRTPPVERYRAIRGTWYSGSSTMMVKNIVVLDSGLDPRSNPADNDEIVSVENINGDTYTSGDKVWADWSVKNARWEARPKQIVPDAPEVAFYTADITNTFSAGTASTPAPGTAEIFAVHSDGTTSSLGTKTLYNPFQIEACGSCACGRLSNTAYLITGPPLQLKTKTVVTSVGCDPDDGLVYDDDTVSYAAPPCES